MDPIRLQDAVARAVAVTARGGQLALAVCFGMLAGCVTDPVASEAHYRSADFATVRKFDAHVHANVAAPEILEQARTDGFELLSINVAYPEFPRLADQEAAVLTLARMDPVRLHFATAFSMDGWGQPDWAARVNRQLDAAVAQGALAVKIWKNVGMDVRGPDGRLVMIDDPGLDPVLAHVQSLGVPLIG